MNNEWKLIEKSTKLHPTDKGYSVYIHMYDFNYLYKLIT